MRISDWSSDVCSSDLFSFCGKSDRSIPDCRACSSRTQSEARVMPAAYPRERASVPRLRDLNRLNVSCRCTRVSVEAGIGQLRNQLVFSGLCCQLRFRLRMNSEDSAVFARFSARRSLIDWAGFIMFLPGALSAIVAPHFSKWQSQTDLDHTSFTEDRKG